VCDKYRHLIKYSNKVSRNINVYNKIKYSVIDNEINKMLLLTTKTGQRTFKQLSFKSCVRCRML
jgi:hypothetical protein